MKSYNQLAYKVVKTYGFESIESLLISDLDINKKQDFIYDLVLEAQKECLKNASEKTSEQYVRPIILNYQEIKDLITNKNNIIK